MAHPFYSSDRAVLHHGDSAELLAELGENTADSMVTDPPSGTGFMGLDWDKDKGGFSNWVEWLSHVMYQCRRCLKPGAHALVWALPRTSFWTALALHYAGFEIRDSIHHNFSTGFPKNTRMDRFLDEEWEGFGTSIKPAHEVWWLCRAPLDQKTISKNVDRWGTGSLNIGDSLLDSSRWPSNQIHSHSIACTMDECHSSCSIRELNRQSGYTKSAKAKKADGRVQEHSTSFGKGLGQSNPDNKYDDEGGASRFYANFRPTEDDFFPFLYQAKPKPKEKCAGLEEEPLKASQKWNSGGIRGKRSAKAEKAIKNCQGLDPRGRVLVREDGTKTLVSRWIPGYSANHHPTVKSVPLMRWLARLITPPGGKVLDPFTGSGSTGVAAIEEGFSFEGIELDDEYCAISKGRLIHAIKENPLKPTRDLTRSPEFQQTLF